MVGQTKSIEMLSKMKDKPHLMIISGEPYTGKTSLCKEFCKIIDPKAYTKFLDGKVKGIREMIEESYENTFLQIYCIEDFESISKQGQNSLLKTFEESPEQAYFIITTNNLSLMLKTIVSRGVVFKMQPYTKEELSKFTTNETILNNWNTPSKISYFKDKDIDSYTKFLETMYSKLTKTNELLIELKDKIAYDMESNGFFYYFFIEDLDKRIKSTYKFKTEDAFLKYNEIINKFYQNITTNASKEELITSLFLHLKEVL